MNKILIKDIPILDRPRERFIKIGVNNLSDEELLSIVLKNGVKGYSVKDLSFNVLKSIKDITDLKNITLNELTKINGIGKVKAITLLSSIELGKRVYGYKDKINIKFKDTKDIYNYMNEITIRGGKDYDFNSNIVLYDNTLVGIIDRVYEKSSVVKLITNKGSKISVKINDNIGVLSIKIMKV